MRFKVHPSKLRPGEWLLIRDDRDGGGHGVLLAILRQPPELSDLDWRALHAMLEALPLASQRLERYEKALPKIASTMSGVSHVSEHMALTAEEALKNVRP